MSEYRNVHYLLCEIVLIFTIIFTLGVCCTDISESDTEISTDTITADFYVSPNGNDSNPGTKDFPWKTIQKASETVKSGNIVIIMNGTYNEYVTISSSGDTSENQIKFISESLHKVKCYGFKITGSYITIDGFYIEANIEYNRRGVYIDKGSFVTVRNCSINECPMGGIRAWGTDNTVIRNCTMDHNGQYGISLIGTNGIIDSNEISRTVQYHPKGDEPGFSGNDADGLRIFGDGHVISGNRIINISDPLDTGNVDPHSDCIQTWDGGSQGRPIMTNTIIENNFFSVNHSSGKGIMISALNGNACHDITIRNNIIEFSDIGISAYNGDYYNIYVYNNLFKANLDEKPWGTSVSFVGIQNYSFQNNITVDCHPQHRNIKEGNGIVDYNLSWNSNETQPVLVPPLQEHEINNVNPGFIKYTGMKNESNYRLSSMSPAIDAGVSLSEVIKDFDGNSRPQGSGFDIGPFESF